MSIILWLIRKYLKYIYFVVVGCVSIYGATDYAIVVCLHNTASAWESRHYVTLACCVVSMLRSLCLRCVWHKNIFLWFFYGKLLNENFLFCLFLGEFWGVYLKYYRKQDKWLQMLYDKLLNQPSKHPCVKFLFTFYIVNKKVGEISKILWVIRKDIKHMRTWQSFSKIR